MLDESGRLPFPDDHFDIIFCSSTIEHVTVDKGVTEDIVWAKLKTLGEGADIASRRLWGKKAA